MKRNSNSDVRRSTVMLALRRAAASALCVGIALAAWSPTATAFGCTPTVELTSPTEGAQGAAPATFILTATAGGCSNLKVQFKANGVLVNTDSNAPFTYTWTDVPAGYYVITATAYTLLGSNNAVTSSPVHVISGEGNGGGNVAPTVTLTAPSDGTTATAPASPILRAIASDYDGTVTSVAFYSNGALLGSDPTAPYRWPLSGLAAGTYQFKAVAIDDAGAATDSGQKTYTVTDATTEPPPTPIAGSVTRTYVYDDNLRLCKTINPESGATVVAYDAAGNIEWTADGTTLTSNTCDRGSVSAAAKTTREYDDRNRLLRVITPGGTADVTTEYEPDGLVKKLTAANPGGANVVTTYGYNKRRLLTAETSLNVAANVSYTLGYGYTGNGHLGAITYPDGQVVTYAPDALGRATQVVGTKDNVSTTYASGLSYYPNGAIKGFTYGNALTHAMTPNLRGLPATSLDKCASGTPGCAPIVILDDRYAYDENGNVTDITDLAQAGKTTRGMDYDGLDRLTYAISPNQWGDAVYTYDAFDNLLSADQGTLQFRYVYDAKNRLDKINTPTGTNVFTFGYDAQGNTISKNSPTVAQALVFDSANRLSQVTGSQTYRYDGQGRRVQTKDADGKETYWIYSQSGQVLHTYEARRSRNLSYIYLGNTQVATRAVALSGAVTVSYQHTDALGSIVAETSSTGAVTKRNAYAPYGEAYAPTVIDGTGYTGHVMDQATGLTYMQARYYDPAIGRFLSVDPVAANAGASFNRYSYAANNPYRFTDPDGRNFTGSRLGDRWGVSSVKSYVLNPADIKASEQGSGAPSDGSVHPSNPPLGPLPNRDHPELDRDRGQYKQGVEEVGRWDGWFANNAANRGRDAADASGLPGRENGPRDAYRHCAASCEVAREVSPGVAIRLGDIHEVYYPGSPQSTHMDRINNRFGAENSGRPGTCPLICGSAIQNGRLEIMPSSTWIDP